MALKKYVLDDHGRQLLLAKYDGTSPQIDELVDVLGVPRYTVRAWAADLGLTNQRGTRWTPKDEQYLEDNWHRESVEGLARKLGHTKAAIKVRAKLLGVRKRDGGYTLQEVRRLLGCGHRKLTVWIERGWLHGERRKTDRRDDIWLFVDEDICRLLMNHPEEIDHRRVDWLRIADLLVDDL